MIKVYYAVPSIYGRKVLAVLEEKNLDYEIERLSFETKDHQKEAYLQINPNGEIPALADEDFVVYESTAIIEYLNDEYPLPPLLPEDSEGRAKVRMVEDYCDLHLFPPLVRCFIKKHVKQEDLAEEDIQEIAAGMKRIESYLQKQEYVAGKEFSLADCAVMSAIASIEGLGIADQVMTSQGLKTYASKLKQRKGYKGANLLTLEPQTAG